MTFARCSLSAKTAKSEWACRSINPGVTVKSEPSKIFPCSSPFKIFPFIAIFPFITNKSALTPIAPVPSIIVAPRIVKVFSEFTYRNLQLLQTSGHSPLAIHHRRVIHFQRSTVNHQRSKRARHLQYL